MDEPLDAAVCSEPFMVWSGELLQLNKLQGQNKWTFAQQLNVEASSATTAVSTLNHTNFAVTACGFFLCADHQTWTLATKCGEA